MGQVKAYAEWAKEEGYLDSSYMPVDPKAGSMDYVDKYVEARNKLRSSNTNQRRKNENKLSKAT